VEALQRACDENPERFAAHCEAMNRSGR
jgi:hypothetical protein